MNNSIDELLSNNVNGASVLLLRLIALLKQQKNPDQIKEIVHQMGEHHSGMVCFSKLQNILEHSNNPLFTVKEFETQWHNSIRTVKQIFKDSYRNFMGKIGIYSHSGTVEHCLEQLNKHFVTLYIPESRPSLEGINMAEQLKHSGFNSIHVMTDACFFSNIKSLDLVVTGCDAVSSQFFINKIGTSAIADLCKSHRIPMVVLGDMSKTTTDDILITLNLKQGKPQEIYSGQTDINSLNPYLERIELSGITVLV